MTYKEYSKLEAKRAKAISRKRSLMMTIRMNEAWEHIGKGSNSKRYRDRQEKLKRARQELSELVVPELPPHPIGYQVLDKEGDFIGFYALDDREYVLEHLEENYGHRNFKLKAKPRYRDDRKEF